MPKQVINTDKAPSPIGPYSQAVRANGMVFLSGQVAFVPATGELELSSLEAETHQVMKNIQAVLCCIDPGFDSSLFRTGFS